MTGSHPGGPPRTAGTPLDEARALVLLVHGRGAGAESILALAPELEREGAAYVAPQAAGSTWYPMSFLAPIEQNEPGLTSAIETLADLLRRAERAGIPAERQLLLGFSQGACLTLEFAARNARRFGGVVGLTGGLIGPPGTPRDYAGSLAGTPVFLGASDPDPHVPWERVEETARVLESLGGVVTLRRYRGMAHTIHPEELDFAGEMLDRILAGRDASSLDP